MDNEPQTINTDTSRTGGTLTLAGIVSDIFSPLLIPTYGMIMAVTLTILRILPINARITATIGIAFITALIPFSFIMLLMRIGKVSDRSISDRRQRSVPLLAMILCYAGAAAYISAIHAPAWLVMFFVGATVTSAISLAITLRWKISGHTAASAGLAGIVFWFAENDIIDPHPLMWVSLSILIVGIVGWSRLVLRRHNLGQITAGAALGFFVEYLLLRITIG